MLGKPGTPQDVLNALFIIRPWKQVLNTRVLVLVLLINDQGRDMFRHINIGERIQIAGILGRLQNEIRSQRLKKKV